MALTDYKITEQQMDENGVISAPDTLTGTAAENKAVFDKLIRKVVDDSIGPVLDTLAGALGAANVGATAIEGLEGTDVQALLAALKALRDADSSSQGAANATVEAALADRYTKAQTDGLLGLKFDAAEAEGLLRSITFDPDTGVFTLTRQDGTSSTIDTLLEKVAVNFELVGGTLVLTLQDGSKQQVDLSSFIDTYTFTDTDTVGFSASGKDIQAQVKNGSITAAKLDPQVTEGIAQQAAQAQAAREGAEAARAGSEAARDLAQTAASTASAKQAQAAASAEAAAASAAGAAGSAQAAAGAQAQTAEDAVLAQSYAVGGTGTRPGEDTDNAKYYKEQAAAIVGGDYATPLDVETAKQEAIDTAAADASSKATAAEAAAKAASVPTSRTVNGHALDADLVLGAADVGAVPTARTVNGHALSADVELTAADVGAATAAYVDEKVANAAAKAKREVVTLPADGWQEAGDGFQQAIPVDWMTTTMQVDLATDPQTDAQLAAAGIRIVPVNAAGTLYAAIYGPTSPATDIQVQLTGIETEATV